MSTIYYISGGRDQNWFATKAKTLAGAKKAATSVYHVANGGKIEIGMSVHTTDYDMGASIQRVAIKDGYNAWRDYT